MSNTISVTFVFDEKYFIEATKKIYDYELKRSKKKYVGWFFIALLQFGLVAALKHDAYGLLYIATFFLLYWYVLRWYIRKRIALRWFKKRPLKDRTVTLRIEKDGISGDLFDVFVPFSKVQETLLFDDGAVLYVEDQAIFLPKSAFASAEDFDRFMRRLKHPQTS